MQTKNANKPSKFSLGIGTILVDCNVYIVRQMQTMIIHQQIENESCPLQRKYNI